MSGLATRYRYRNYNGYRTGGGYYICDRCGQRHRRWTMQTEWTGLKVDPKCLDPRPPQMMPPNVYPEGIPFLDARPPQDNPDRLWDDTTLYPVVGGIAASVGLYVTSPAGQQLGQGAGIGALSPQNYVETVQVAVPLGIEGGGEIGLEGGGILGATTTGTPQGPNVLEDDITFITGKVGS